MILNITKEPTCLLRGKTFHKKIQEDWKKTAQGDVVAERTVLKLNKRRGRVDIFVNDDDPEGTIAIIEIKASNWDIMTEKAVKRNVRRQINQIYGYIDSQINKGEYVSTGEHKSVSPAIIFPKSPNVESRKKYIEERFYEDGIVVVWHNEK